MHFMHASFFQGASLNVHCCICSIETIKKVHSWEKMAALIETLNRQIRRKDFFVQEAVLMSKQTADQSLQCRLMAGYLLIHFKFILQTILGLYTVVYRWISGRMKL